MGTAATDTESRIIRLKIKHGLISNWSGINSSVHPMQCHSVPWFAVQYRPARCVHAGILRQRPRMQVKGADPSSGKDCGVDHKQ